MTFGVVGGARQRITDPEEPAVGVAGNLNVMSSGLALTRVQVLMGGP